MPRVFIAVDLSDEAIHQLVGIQPRSGPGVRVTRPEQIHVTLHFLGDVPVDEFSVALRKVTASAFSITIAGVGSFRSPDGGAIVWAGVKHCPPLLELHAAISSVLIEQDIQPEARPYSPHITLARIKPFAADFVPGYLRKHASFQLPEQAVTMFHLYSSSSVNGRSEYRCEASYPMKCGANSG